MSRLEQFRVKTEKNFAKGNHLRSTEQAAHRVLIRFVQCLCAFFRQLKELRGKSYYPVRVALFYFAPIVAHNFVFACTGCDAKHNPPVRLKVCGRPVMLSSSVSLRLAFFLCMPPPLLRFSSL